VAITIRIEEGQVLVAVSNMVKHRIKIRDSSTVNSSSVIINLVGVSSSKTTSRGSPQHLRTIMDRRSTNKTSSRVNIVLNPNSHQMATSNSKTITTLSSPRKEEDQEMLKVVQEVDTIKIIEVVSTKALLNSLNQHLSST
jgi:hypothetical protein